MQNENNQNPQAEIEMPVPSVADVEAVAEAVAPMGNSLSAAREAKRLSVGDAAYALKVGNKVIQAIEASDWQALPGRTFTVGILRAYGRLLDVPVDAIIAEVPGGSPAVKKNHVQASTATLKAHPAARRDGETKRQEKRMLKLGLVMVVLAVVLAYAMPGNLWDETFESAQSLVNRWVRQDVVQPQTDSAAVPAPADAAKPAESGADVVAQAPTSPGTLELKFAAPAWVEVRDHTGRIIYSQLNAAGTTQFITGAAPLDVLIGNARQVQARWRDEPVKLDKLTGDDVSRQVLR
ncbi:MAG: helix-turn-helix domain-containing protein [Fluviibacter sp.]|jgi:cytoskeleton protein RodZ